MPLSLQDLLTKPRLLKTIDRSNTLASYYANDIFPDGPVRIFQILASGRYRVSFWDAPAVPNEISSYGFGGYPDLRLSAFMDGFVGHQMPGVFDFGFSGIRFTQCSIALNPATVGAPLEMCSIVYLYDD